MKGALMRIATILTAAVLGLVVLAAPVLAHHRDGHAGGPPSGAQQHANKENKGNGQGGSNRFDAENAQDCEAIARNHGQYVSCIAYLVHAAQGDVKAEDLGLDSDCDSAENLIACAAHSDVGKANKGEAKNSKAKNGSAGNKNKSHNDNEVD
jgi:hypothetical protein